MYSNPDLVSFIRNLIWDRSSADQSACRRRWWRCCFSAESATCLPYHSTATPLDYRTSRASAAACYGRDAFLLAFSPAACVLEYTPRTNYALARGVRRWLAWRRAELAGIPPPFVLVGAQLLAGVAVRPGGNISACFFFRVIRIRSTPIALFSERIARPDL